MRASAVEDGTIYNQTLILTPYVCPPHRIRGRSSRRCSI